jgi:hypothetical protein
LRDIVELYHASLVRPAIQKDLDFFYPLVFYAL